MDNAPEMKRLLPRQREFVDLMVYQGLTLEEAYKQAYKVKDVPPEKLHRRAYRVLYTPHIYNYYEALMDEVREREIKKAVWTKDIATQKLMRLVERAEEELYGVIAKDGTVVSAPKKITMSNLNAIILPIKELNLMHGLNQLNVNTEGCIVKIVGEEDLPD